MAFHSRKFPLVSFSCGGNPRKVWVAVDEEAKVVIAPMVLGDMVAEVVDMISVAKVDAISFNLMRKRLYYHVKVFWEA